MLKTFLELSEYCSKAATIKYSTSFNSAIKTLHKDLRAPIYNIYGFVRFADEIVDTFHDWNKDELLSEFKKDTYKSIKQGISLNPILQSFQSTVNKYSIDHKLIEAFFVSMEMDLKKQEYNESKYQDYIFGSAEVVGLMCLHVFCEGDKEQFENLKPAAQALGAGFQKINFLRDLKADFESLDRTYFPNVDFKNFKKEDKIKIEAEIAEDFKKAFDGIQNLPVKAKFGVYVAYKYYVSLLHKIQEEQAETIMNKRIRIPNYQKAMILMRASVRHQLNLI
jgi:15-cis-phytoene synthase